MNQVVTELVIDARQATAGGAAYERAMAGAAALAQRAMGINNAIPQSLSRVEAAYDRLKARIDPVFNANQQLARGLGLVDRAVVLGVTTEEQATRDILALKQRQVDAIERVRDAQMRANAVANDNLPMAGGNSIYRAQNLSYQLQDIGVSLAGGLPITTVLLQQGSQIVQLYAGAGGVNAALKDLGGILSMVVRFAGPFIAAGIAGYGAYRLLASYSQEAAVQIDSATAALAAQAQPISAVNSAIDDLGRMQQEYQKAIHTTASAQDFATRSIVANTEREFNAKKSLLELELKRQQAAIAAAQAEMATAGINLKGDIATGVFINMDTERRGFSDPRIGSVPFVRLPDDITGLEKTQQLLDSNPLKDKLIELRANLELTEIGTQRLGEALELTFDGGVAPIDKAAAAAGRAYRNVVKEAQDRIAQMQLEAELGGEVGIAAQRLRFEQDLLAKATDNGRSVSEAQRREIAALAEQYAAWAEASASVRLQQDLLFERDQLFRNPIDREIASMQRGAGLPIDLDSVDAQLKRVNMQLELGRDLALDFASSFKNDLMNGVKPIEALGNAFGRLGDKLLDIAMNEAINSLFANLSGSGDPWAGMRTTGKIGGGGGGILSGLFSWIPKLFGFADGTAFAPGGPARVNEVGGEIINLPRGSQVIPHDVSMRMAAAPSASRGSTTLNVNVRVDGARGDQHIVNLVHVGVSRGIQAFQESPEFEMGAARATAKAKRDGSVRGL